MECMHVINISKCLSTNESFRKGSWQFIHKLVTGPDIIIRLGVDWTDPLAAVAME